MNSIAENRKWVKLCKVKASQIIEQISPLLDGMTHTELEYVLEEMKSRMLSSTLFQAQGDRKTPRTTQ